MHDVKIYSKSLTSSEALDASINCNSIVGCSLCPDGITCDNCNP